MICESASSKELIFRGIPPYLQKRAALNIPAGALHLSQMPRFIGETTGHSARIRCQASAEVKWYKLFRYDQDRKEAVEVKAGKSIKLSAKDTTLKIMKLRVEDSGVYLCKVNDTWGAGTQLLVASKGTAERPPSLIS